MYYLYNFFEISGVNLVVLFGCSVYPGHLRGVVNGNAVDRVEQ
jgi:hypothetical protein